MNLISLEDLYSLKDAISFNKAEGSVTSTAFDSREATQGSLFICIPGEKVDGHDFITSAYDSGARFFLGSNPEKIKSNAIVYTDAVFINVPNIQLAVWDLARAVRNKLSCPVICITGACGKTTTKDFTKFMLSNFVSVHATPKNNNNLWGVPMTLLQTPSDVEVLVLELGMNEPGELKILSSIAKPTIAYTTGIGPSHLEKLGSVEGVLKAETEHIDWLLENNLRATLIINLDDPLLAGYFEAKRAQLNSNFSVYTLSTRDRSGADCRLLNLSPSFSAGGLGYRFEFETPWGRGAAELGLPGLHNVQNALAALSLCSVSLLASPAQFGETLIASGLTPLRSETFNLKTGSLILNDSYNANPMSMSAAFSTLSELSKNPKYTGFKKIAVLGDMLELGTDASKYHSDTAKEARTQGFNELWTSGEFSKNYSEGFGDNSVEIFDTRDELIQKLKEKLSNSKDSYLVLIKASHGSRFDVIADSLRTLNV